MPRWSVRIEKAADRDLSRLGASDRSRVLRFLHCRLAELQSPRQLGAPLHGKLAGYWKYRVGDIRIVAELLDGELLVMVVQVGNRGEIYR